MQTNILEYLEKTAERVPDKTAFADEKTSLTFYEFEQRAKKTGTYLAQHGIYHQPVIVYMKKTPDILAAFFGVVYGGCFYVPIDEEMPDRRIKLILENTQARALICDEETAEKARSFDFEGITVLYSECLETKINETELTKIRNHSLDIDPVYIFYTSGSTGIPKGVVGCHRGIIDYIENLSEVLGFDENCIFANQTPLYWDASMKEIYATLKYGATTYLVPKSLFMFPVQLVEYLNNHRINTICWVVSALTMISAFGTFDIVKPEFLKKIAFCGEVFPVKQFNIWKKTLPDASFYNLYGPTEATGVSTYYHAERLFGEDEIIPIGRPFANTQILLLDEKNKEVEEGAVGEICIRGSGVTLGYYHAMDKTETTFTQNPLNPYYHDRIYHTGDLARRDDEGNLIFVSRQDYQIKHMGHRIELGEIEADVGLIDGVYRCCCIYVKEKNKIVLFYEGEIDKKTLTKALRERLPHYMLPNAIMPVALIPLLPNGKMDRLQMKTIYLNHVAKKKDKIQGGGENE